MAAFIQKHTATVLMLLGALLVWYQAGVVLHQQSLLAQQHPQARATGNSSPKDAVRGNPGGRSLKQLEQMDNLEGGANGTPFEPAVFREKSEGGSEMSLGFMCVNETQLWEEVSRNNSLVKLRQYDGKSALVQAVLDDLDKDSINSDLQFEQYLERFSMEEKKIPKVRKVRDANAMPHLPNSRSIYKPRPLFVHSAVDFQKSYFQVNNLPRQPALRDNTDRLVNNVLQTVQESERYYQMLQNVNPHIYRVPNEQAPSDLPNLEDLFSQHSDGEETKYLDKEDLDYLQDSDESENNPNDLMDQNAYPNPSHNNMSQLNFSRDTHLWVRPRDVNNAARLAHPQSFEGAPQLDSADLHRHFDRKLNGANVQMDPDLIQMKNFELPANSDLHTSRHFPSSHNFSALADYKKYLDTAANVSLPKYRSETQYSLNPDLLLRSRFQQRKMQDFCAENRLTARLPSSIEDLDTLFQHLLYDDSKRIVYCYVPKNGCSNMKRTLLILNGILPPESVATRPAETKLKEVNSFRNLSRDQALYRLENYFKFAIVRNPMERLLSAYRNKLEPPLRAELRTLFPDKVKAYILKRYRKTKFLEWLDNKNDSVKIMPTFQEFLRFMAQFPLSLYNEHFMPVLNLCYPCAVQYDLYLNFKSLDYDVYALLDYLDIPKSFYPNAISHKGVPTSSHFNEYFGNVTKGAKERLFRVLAKELRLYYALHPEEWFMHRQLMYASLAP